VVVTFAAPAGLGSLAAQAYQAHEIQASQAAIARAHRDFGRQVARSLLDGTPKELLDPVVTEEAGLYTGALPPAGAFIDRVRVVAYQQRASALLARARRIRAVELQVEVDLRSKFLQAIVRLRADEAPAKELGLDVSDYESYAVTAQAQHPGLLIPKAMKDLVAAVDAKDQGLKDATEAKREAIEAFQRAQSDAGHWLQRAQATLAQARTIQVLKLDDIAAAINALAARLSSATTTADYQDIAAGLRAQAGLLSKILQTRQDAYALRDKARARLQRAQQGGMDMSAESSQLDAASAQLDAAGDLDSINTARQQVQAAKNSIDVKYNLAVYGPGKVLVVSLQDQELEALQDGVVLQDTLITSGRPALPTPVGNWTVTAKYSPYHFISPWPKGSPYYYNPSWVNWAMLFHDGGYFVHDAPWRYHYGPGSDSEFGGTHGCVNVPAGTMNWLYDWAQVGTPVDVIAGEF